MDRRTILAISLCFLIYVGWQKYYLEPRMPRQTSTQLTQTATGMGGAAPQGQTPGAVEGATSEPAGGATHASHAAAAEARKHHPTETKTVAMGTGDVVLGDGSDVLNGWKLKNYRLGLTAETGAVDLDSVTNSPSEISLSFDDPSLAYLNSIQGNITSGPSGISWVYDDSNVKITRDVVASEQSNFLDLKINVEFKGKRPNFAFLSLISTELQKDPEERDRQLLFWSNQALDRVSTKKASLKEITTPVKYIGAQNRYFVLALLNQSPVEPKGLVQQLDPLTARASMVYPVTGNSITLPVHVYFGPKELTLLRSVDPALDNTVDFGWFAVVAYPLLRVLQWLYSDFIHNYGVAIIILTILLKVVTFPLTYKSMKSMKEMAKIQPQLARVKEKYKDDREALNREMLTLMRSHGYNPAAGCLPMLIQIPIFYGLYRVLYSSIELYHAPFAFWIKDLSAHDPLYVTPVVMSLLMFVQQKLQPSTATDPTQQKMMQMMPLIFGAFMLALPSGLTLYYLVNTLAAIVQQLYLNKKLDIRRAGAH